MVGGFAAGSIANLDARNPRVQAEGLRQVEHGVKVTVKVDYNVCCPAPLNIGCELTEEDHDLRTDLGNPPLHPHPPRVVLLPWRGPQR